MSSGRIITGTARNMTLTAAAGDIFSLEGVATVAGEILEVRVWQIGTTTLTLDEISLHRGAGAAIAGTTVTEYEYDSLDTAVMVARSLPTVDVATLDLKYTLGWNLLQELLWLPTPTLQIPLKELDDFGVFREGSVAHTGVGCSVTWLEHGV